MTNRATVPGVMLVALAVGTMSEGAEPVSWLVRGFNPRLWHINRLLAASSTELGSLGKPVIGQTVEQFGYQHSRLATVPPEPAWVQVDFGRIERLDWIALVPAQVSWQAFDRPAYGFPKRFRVDLADDPEFRSCTNVADYTESDFHDPGVAPLAFRVNGQEARYLRVTVTRFASDNSQHFFALAEIMALAGNCNIAVNRSVTASDPYQLLPHWSPKHLVDGRTPLGPPIREAPTPCDGLFCGTPPDETRPSIQIDLGRIVELQEVRLHPVHGRSGADTPGYGFPRSFRVETSQEAAFDRASTLFEAIDFSNPGNNSVTIPAAGIPARSIRIVYLAPDVTSARRFGLSEVQVYAGNTNVARQGTVTASPDTIEKGRYRLPTLLTDGLTSYGRLMEWPEWLDGWTRRRELLDEIETLEQQRIAGEGVAVARAQLAGGAAVVIWGAAVGGYVLRSRRRRRQELQALRERLARDLHDEIGSNLASIGILSEMAVAEGDPGKPLHEDWQEVERITRETILSMREMLWVLGARQEAGADLIEQLRRTARRMLTRSEVIWLETPEHVPGDWPVDARRQVFLFFKEALANIARHARASRVELAMRIDSREVQVEIRDNGTGFDRTSVQAGAGLPSLQSRARDLRGRLTIESTPGSGTTIVLRVPL